MPPPRATDDPGSRVPLIRAVEIERVLAEKHGARTSAGRGTRATGLMTKTKTKEKASHEAHFFIR